MLKYGLLFFSCIIVKSIHLSLRSESSAKKEDDLNKLWFKLNFGFSGLFVTTKLQ